MRGSLLQRTAFVLGVFARRSVQVAGLPLRAAGKLVARLRGRHAGPVPERRRLPAPRPRQPSHELAVPRYLDPDVEARCRSARSAAELPPAEAAPLLLALLHDGSAEVRSAAADAAGRSRAVTTVFSLILALDDPSPLVRSAAERSVRRLTGREITFAAADGDRREQIEELKSWWKKQRLRDLTGRLSEGRE